MGCVCETIVRVVGVSGCVFVCLPVNRECSLSVFCGRYVPNGL